MKFRKRLIFVFFAFITFSCSLQNEEPISITSNTFDFAESEHGWKYGFSGYPVSQDSAASELKYAYTDKPAALSEGKSLMLSGNNVSSELFMYIKKQLVGLRPETDYTITFNVELASGSSNQSPSSVTAPSAFLKVGATGIEPISIKTSEKVVMNIDKGSESEDGSDMINIGNILNVNTSDFSLILKSSSSKNPTPIKARTNSDGEMWLIVGTDSNFQGTTTVFYTKINVVLTVSSK